MKLILAFIMILALAGFQRLSAQEIIAGQQSGPYIIYSNPDDIQLYCDLVNTSIFYSLDIDQDGLNDMDFYAVYFYYSHIGQRGTNTGINLKNNIQISRVDTLQYSTFQHQPGDTISGNLHWIPGEMATLNSYSNIGTTEYFKGEGYIGFRICATDTIYGWIHARVSGNTETAKIIIYDYAYCAKHNMIDEHQDKPVISCSNPVHDYLIINIPDKNSNAIRKCSVYDFSARHILEKELYNGDNLINMTSFNSGSYFVVIGDKHGRSSTFKIIKQ